MLPAVLAVLLVCLTGLQLAITQVQLESAAASAARSIARGESESAAEARAAKLVMGATLNVFRRDGMLCAVVTRAPSGPIESMLGITLSSTSCSLANST